MLITLIFLVSFVYPLRFCIVLTSFPTVNNAAAGTYGASLDTPTEDMERIFRTNVFGALYMLKAAVPYMPRGSRVINISSIASKLGIGVLPIYGASKAALDSLSYAWAQEVRKSFELANIFQPFTIFCLFCLIIHSRGENC